MHGIELELNVYIRHMFAMNDPNLRAAMIHVLQEFLFWRLAFFRRFLDIDSIFLLTIDMVVSVCLV